MEESLQDIIGRLWTTPERSEWIPRTDVLALSDIHKWMASKDIEVLGFIHAMLHDRRFRIEPPISQSDYIKFTKHYFERCLQENPSGEWSDSRYSAGGDLVNIFASLWTDSTVPRAVLTDLKMWIGELYKAGEPEIRTCIVQATLEHLFEQKDIRKFFSDWQKDEVLKAAHDEASEWYRGGGRTPLGRPPAL
jgi:hypothetical protein